jgi:hypothetical protein
MKQCHSTRSAFAAALLLCAPLLAHAQQRGEEPRPRLTVSAYTGVRAPFGGGFVSAFTPTDTFVVRQDRAGSPLLGMDAKLHLRGPVSLVAGGVYSQVGEVQFFLSDTTFFQSPDWISGSTDPMWFGKLGLAAHFERERSITETSRRPSTDLFAAAAAVREFGYVHPAVNVGFQGSFPLAGAVELVVGVEDYLVFWRGSGIGPEIAERVSRRDPRVNAVQLHFSTSNVFQLHLGASLKAW